MYLMDGEQRIMISDALNESDRLSSCSKRVRKSMKAMGTPFNVYAFQTVPDADVEDSPDDFILKYNLNGIRISEAAFQRLKQEISLELSPLDLPKSWEGEEFHLWSGLVPVGNDIFRKIVVRGAACPRSIPTISPSSSGPSAGTTKSAPTPPLTPSWKAKPPPRSRLVWRGRHHPCCRDDHVAPDASSGQFVEPESLQLLTVPTSFGRRCGREAKPDSRDGRDRASIFSSSLVALGRDVRGNVMVAATRARAPAPH